MSRLLYRLGSRPFLKLAASAAVGGGIAYQLTREKSKDPSNMLPFNANTIQLEALSKTDNEENPLHSLWTPPSRAKLIDQLKSSVNPNEEYDLLVIGGGATGAGIALDAASRGLKVALVERDDFSSGTSSRSTKLVHGGVRYLEKAFRNLDYEQYKLVVEALHERSVFLKIAPYLSNQLPIMLPVYKWWHVPYYWAGAKFYDLFAGGEGLQSSYFLGRGKTLDNFPMLQKDSLKGAIVYYDGQHNDSRMNVALALTAIAQGATVVNHVEVQDLVKVETDSLNKIRGAKVKDVLTGEEFQIKAKGVINATGPFTDAIRKMDDPTTPTIVAPSAGVHIILPNYYSPAHMGLLDPATSDGRVIFFLPWQGNVIAGTTDTPTNVSSNPMPTEDEINWILGEVRRYLDPDVQVRRGDVLAAWSGIRPLVRDPAASNTASLVRNHVVHVSQNGLLTIAGGKWTTYRSMAQEAVDEAIKFYGLTPKTECVTERLKLIGTHKYSSTMFIQLIQHFGMETEVAQHLSSNYGDRAWAVAHLCQPTGLRWPLHGTKLTPAYPYLEAEVRHAVRYEYACTAIDAVARRMRLAFLNAQTTLDVLPKVIDIMAEELGWDAARKQRELQDTTHYLSSMGLRDATADWKLLSEAGRARFQPLELGKYRTAFGDVDKENDGHIEGSELVQLVGTLNLGVDESTIRDGMQRAGVREAGSVEFFEFLEVLGKVKEIKDGREGKVTMSPRAHEKLTTERSGGGV